MNVTRSQTLLQNHNKMGGHRPEGRVTDPRNKRVLETGTRQRRMERLLRESWAQKRLQLHTWMNYKITI